MDQLTNALRAAVSNGTDDCVLPGAGKLKDLCGHAESIWQFLDDLAEHEPEEYNKFLRRQAEAAGVAFPPEGGLSAGARPQPVFSLQLCTCIHLEGWNVFNMNFLGIVGIVKYVWRAKIYVRIVVRRRRKKNSED